MSSTAASPAASLQSATKRPEPAVLRRARPLLGTSVAIAVAGLAERAAHAAIERGFAEIARIHALMSFQEHASDLSRLNRGAAARAVAVDPSTFEVVSRALEFAQASGGVFDPSVAARLVAWGYLPRPQSAPEPEPDADWRDIELLDRCRIRFKRPLWIDLGGIAKGYAVDRALAAMDLSVSVQCSVNAGGDVRVRGPRAERILLRTDGPIGDDVPVVEIENGSLASSSGRREAHVADGVRVGPHLDAARRRAVGTRSFVSVAADECIVADALTKIVLARGARAAPLLKRYAATAYLQTARNGWRILGAEA